MAACTFASVIAAIVFSLWRATSTSSELAAKVPTAPASSAISSADNAIVSEGAKHSAGVPQEQPKSAGPAGDVDREIELAAQLEELAHRDLKAAADFLLSLPDSDRRLAVTAVLTAAASQPQDAVDLGNFFIRTDPENATSHGHCLIDVLVRADQTAAALQFIQNQNATAGASEDPYKWSMELYTAWSKKHPELAVQHAAHLSPGGMQDEVLRVVVRTWAQQSPLAAADSARNLPAGPARIGAIEASLQAWAVRDPAAAGQWLGQLKAGAELDGATAALATHPQSLAQTPELAAGWAARIINPELRSRTVAEVLKTWATKSPDQARRFAERVTGSLLPEDRALVIAALNRPPD